jgi:hypothetical protein
MKSADEGAELLKQYATSFRRDAPLWTKAQIRMQTKHFRNHMSVCQRESSLQQLAKIIETGDMPNFLRIFIYTYTEIDQQYCKILNARRLLFANDISATLTPPDFYVNEAVEEICWEKEGAEIAAAFSAVDLPADKPFCTCQLTVTLSLKPAPTYLDAPKKIK